MEEKILTKHPKRKSGFNVNKNKYDVIRKSIVECLQIKKELIHTELEKMVKSKLKDKFKGSIPWYNEVVKLDLEARKIIERMPNAKPERYRLIR